MFRGNKKMWALGTAGMLAVGIGCHSDKPHDYGQERPDVNSLSEGDKGLQSKDVISATDQLASDLLALPDLNDSKTQWTMVVTNVENHTTDPRFDYDIFTERLRTRLSRLGHGRVALIENKEKLHQLQSQELEGAPRDTFGQGAAGTAAPGPAGIQPDFALYGKIIEMPNRATSYYFCEFNVTNLRTREQVWSREYEVKAAR